ncbi:hypothetical protein RED65_11852 [Oceanobacter sp. RED65]|uniref:Uncharacterized protein n=1 Tax=Bermanella marisrubri TaxID=207949 RepID=Q1MXQ1_9GAMM|nr:hypothetical protein RED65_11852 [Oceanobacter sp. RED65] [Bermanella marisrubri]
MRASSSGTVYDNQEEGAFLFTELVEDDRSFFTQ